MSLKPFFAYRSFNPTPDDVRNFVNIGCDTVQIFPANTLNSLGKPYSCYGPTWLSAGEYNFGPLDRQVGELLAIEPGLRILCMIDLNTPDWWVRTHSFGGAVDTFSQLGQMVGNAKWQQDTTDYLQAFLQHTESHYANSIASYILAAGYTTEWQDRSCGRESPVRRAAWRQWSIENGYDDPVDIPSASVREHVSHDGLLRDPQVDAIALRYWRFCSEQIADTILVFGRSAQERIQKRVPLGAFYGYILEHAQGRLVSEGHLSGHRLLLSQEIDFLVAPGTYAGRQSGGASAFMVPVGSAHRHGKGYVHEIDHRTHTSRSPDGRYGIGFGVWKNETETIAGLRREFAYCLIEGVAFWWFNMWGGFYDSPAVLAEIAHMKTIWDLWHEQTDGAAQIAWIVDEESARYMNEKSSEMSAYMAEFRQVLGHVGAPYKVFYMEDLDVLDLSSFRLLIFANAFVVNREQELLLRERVLCDERTVVWFGQPGVIQDGVYRKENMSRFVVPDAESVLQPMGNWYSLYSASPIRDSVRLQEIARTAGVHIYNDQNHSVIYANQHLIACHVAITGTYRVATPKGCTKVHELFSGREIFCDQDGGFTDMLHAPTTVLYQIVE